MYAGLPCISFRPTSYTDETNYVLSELQKVYFVDREAKKLPAVERLELHLKLS